MLGIAFSPKRAMKHDTWLTSDNFLKRCFAIYGHALVAHVIVSAVFLLLWVLMMGVFAAMFFHGMRDARTGKPMDMMRQGQRQEMQMDMRDQQMPMRRTK